MLVDAKGEFYAEHLYYNFQDEFTRKYHFFILFLTRLLFQKLRISHKYIVGLWFILFFYLAVPWKINLPVGFWNHGLIHSPFTESVSSNILDGPTYDYAAETDSAVYPSAADHYDILGNDTDSNENNRITNENSLYNIFETLLSKT